MPVKSRILFVLYAVSMIKSILLILSFVFVMRKWDADEKRCLKIIFTCIVKLILPATLHKANFTRLYFKVTWNFWKCTSVSCALPIPFRNLNVMIFMCVCMYVFMLKTFNKWRLFFIMSCQILYFSTSPCQVAARSCTNKGSQRYPFALKF